MINSNIGSIIIETAATDNNVYPSQIIKNDGDRVLAQGVLQEANAKNRNGRFYDSRDLYPELSSPRQMELLNSGNMKAENGHPITKDLARQQTIDPNNTVAVFGRFWTEGNLVMGTFMGDENEKGASFDRELRKGRKPSWSLRALGNIQNTRRGAEVKNIKIITYDRVIYPSHDKAYTIGLVNESATMVDCNKDCQLYVEENDKGIIIPITNDAVINYIKNESANFNVIKESFDLLYDNIELVNRGTQVKLTDRAGGIFVVNLESYIHDEIMNNCCGSLGVGSGLLK